MISDWLENWALPYYYYFFAWNSELAVPYYFFSKRSQWKCNDPPFLSTAMLLYNAANSNVVASPCVSCNKKVLNSLFYIKNIYVIHQAYLILNNKYSSELFCGRSQNCPKLARKGTYKEKITRSSINSVRKWIKNKHFLKMNQYCT